PGGHRVHHHGGDFWRHRRDLLLPRGLAAASGHRSAFEQSRLIVMVEAQEQQAAPRSGSGRARWYIVHAYSNFEQKVAEAIRDQAQRQGLQDQFEDIQVPTEEVTEVVRGAKKVRQHRHFPGYVLVKMEMTDEAYHLVKNTPKVTGFLGTQNKPQPVSDREVERILGRVAEVGAQ